MPILVVIDEPDTQYTGDGNSYMDKTTPVPEKIRLTKEQSKALKKHICNGIYKQLYQDGFLSNRQIAILLHTAD